MSVWTIAAIILVFNIPFGYWRSNVRKLSPQWFAAVHAPVPVVMALRLSSGLGWELATIPVLMVAFFCGQYLGGSLHRMLKTRTSAPVTSCLVVDLSRRVAGLLA